MDVKSGMKGYDCKITVSTAETKKNAPLQKKIKKTPNHTKKKFENQKIAVFFILNRIGIFPPLP